MQELDQDHGTNVLREPAGIADINSSLEVQLDSTALRQRVSKLVGTGQVSPAVVAQLAALQAMAVTRLQQVQQYREALERYTGSKTPESLKALRSALTPLARDARTLIRAAKADPALGARLEAKLNAFFSSADTAPRTEAEQYELLLAFAGEEAANARRALDAEARQAGARIQVGTWLSTSQGVRPVHTTGLDQTEPSSPYVVDRWAIALDADQRKQLQALERAAQAANTNGAAGLVSELTSTVRQTLEVLSAGASDCAKTLSTAVEGITRNAGETPPAGASQLITQLETHVKTLEKSAADLAALAGKYRTPSTTTDAAAFLEATNADLTSIKTMVETVRTTFDQVKSALSGASSTLLQGGNLAGGASGLKSALDSCRSIVKDAFDGLTGAFPGTNHAEQIRALSEEAWKNVLSFDVGDLPATSTLQLTTAGPRRAGDLVLVRVAATRGTDAKHEILDEQQVTLQRVLPHLELSVGLVFADPLGSSAVVHRFQAAPAYSVLYRRGSRRSMARNSFWNVGVGLNVAAVDFDKDDVPELGLGVTTSALADLLQAGVGYNVFLDRAYWFFGVRLPVGILSLAGNRTPVDTDAPQGDH